MYSQLLGRLPLLASFFANTFGEISDEEWEFRKREPMSHAGPWNLCPFLDKWVETGGHANVCLSIGFITFSLPYMPLGSASTIPPAMSLPSYGELLSLRRFILRSKAIRDQSVCYMRHPLFLELAAFSLPGYVARVAGVAQQCRKSKGPPAHFSDKSLTPAEQASSGLVISTGGTSIGNVGCQICHLSICSPNLLDLLLPREYPVGSKRPTISLKTYASRVRCRSAELYLTAETSQQQLHTNIFWDENVFDERLVRDWLEEIRCATNFYLGYKLEMLFFGVYRRNNKEPFIIFSSRRSKARDPHRYISIPTYVPRPTTFG